MHCDSDTRLVEEHFDPYARARHVRYVEKDVVYHVVSRTAGNLFLVRPDIQGKLRKVVAGILAKAKETYPEVANYGLSMLSNHLHACLGSKTGDPEGLANYIGFLKRELTRRWKEESALDWVGSIWAGYEYSAAITPRGQLTVLEYVLGQGVKENLVESPFDWPGFHCAESIVNGKPVQGFWFDGTAHGKAFHAEKVKKNPGLIEREDFYVAKEFTFDRLPALDHLTDQQYRDWMRQSVDRIVEEGRKRRGDDEQVLGVEKICTMDPLTSRSVPKPPWFEDRKKQIVWDDLSAPEVKAYIRRHWDHQTQYRRASRDWRKSKAEPEGFEAFPEICFIPGRARRPIPQTAAGAT